LLSELEKPQFHIAPFPQAKERQTFPTIQEAQKLPKIAFRRSLGCQDILAKTKASVNTKIDKETAR